MIARKRPCRVSAILALVVLVGVLFLGLAEADPLVGSESSQSFQLAGSVRQGQWWSDPPTSNPLVGVTVSLHCSVYTESAF